MKILVTGASGFIGKNVVSQLGVSDDIDILTFGSDSSLDDLSRLISKADFVCHLAGVNRPDNEREFAKVNTNLTRTLCKILKESKRALPIIFASSVHVDRDNSYGKSKFAAEKLLLKYSEETNAPVYIFRLSHVVGKWCRPNYNSVVATFCYNIARNLPVQIDDPDFQLNVVYIDDLVLKFRQIMFGGDENRPYCKVNPSYPVSVGELAQIIHSFKESRDTLTTERVGDGLIRILYSTYISYLPTKDFVYGLKKHSDSRGIFVEMLKTKDSGQFSFFTAHPGITRGGHYHHSKTEKFLVIKGDAKFKFKNIITDEFYEVKTSGEKPEIVETIPGWAHDITNVGDNEMIVMLWANEIFDQKNPDTYISML
jgi:UDP-2-acetamido-2,6-beta-L-arabino-hexul-4-ose reductase